MATIPNITFIATVLRAAVVVKALLKNRTLGLYSRTTVIAGKNDHGIFR